MNNEEKEFIEKNIEEIEFTIRTKNVLKKNNINNVRELLKLTPKQLISCRNFGKKSLFEIQEKLCENGLYLKDDEKMKKYVLEMKSYYDEMKYMLKNFEKFTRKLILSTAKK